ncbi:hypothetical protein SJ05684_c30330 [Sinorhizobium sojae CCBAU 05684]|uniref:UPF0335 protein SJ05684_c30330 n=2 Tax=Sinorhizobium sojae TaxID=716925 RepID=A0A249PFH6_9HYPH|nr:hypothetical protein SJ05684_c30330 [Sinorhizobium sojae CCBAU 05684]
MRRLKPISIASTQSKQRRAPFLSSDPLPGGSTVGAMEMTDAQQVSRDQLRAFIERIERLEEEKKTIADDIKDVYGEAKAMGFDTKILKQVISIRKMDGDERMEQEAILDTYLQALGMVPAAEDEA